MILQVPPSVITPSEEVHFAPVPSAEELRPSMLWSARSKEAGLWLLKAALVVGVMAAAFNSPISTGSMDYWIPQV